jgi:ribonuclease HI
MNFDYIVRSDGSGHVDGYGGWACSVTAANGHVRFRFGAIVGTTVDRMEMTAMLEGLTLVFEWATWAAGTSTLPTKPKVLVLTDRESMALSMQGVYARKSSIDLWRRFEFFEPLMEIQVRHVAGETEHELCQVDLHASSGRLVAKEYAVLSDLPSHLANPNAIAERKL